jgi:hypothetical protein
MWDLDTDMAEEFEIILDNCIDRLNRGESLDQCLNDYPEHAAELKPLLLAMKQTKEAFPHTPSPDVKRTAREHFFAAMDKRRQPSYWDRVTAWQPAWATIASIAMVLVLTVVALNTGKTHIGAPHIELPSDEPLPSGIYSTIVPASSSDGNFVFYVSDEENAIGDFDSLFITIDNVVLLKNGSPEELVTFTPEVPEFDLSLLPGEKTQEIWRGSIPEGSYSKIFVYISEVKGILNSTKEEISLKLPSGKLQLSYTFQVTETDITNFVFDMTIVKTGQVDNGKYLLKPQASESGATLTTQTVPTKDKGKPVK